MMDNDMKDTNLIQIETMDDGLFKVKFSGERQINSMIDCWLEIRHVVNKSYSKLLVLDCMMGELSLEGIGLIIELLSEYDFFIKLKIAIVLAGNDSYNTHFFNVFAKHWGLNIKHFLNEKEAVSWLVK